jgi:hypothetical protein
MAGAPFVEENTATQNNREGMALRNPSEEHSHEIALIPAYPTFPIILDRPRSKARRVIAQPCCNVFLRGLPILYF